jgi:hypothetical protein
MSAFLAFRKSLDLCLNPQSTFTLFKSLPDKSLVRSADYFRLLAYAHGYRINPMGDHKARLSTVQSLESSSTTNNIRLDDASVKMILDTYARSGLYDDMKRIAESYSVTLEPIKVLMAKTAAGVVEEKEARELFEASAKEYGERRVRLLLMNALADSMSEDNEGPLLDQFDQLKSVREGALLDATAYKHVIRFVTIHSYKLDTIAKETRWI